METPKINKNCPFCGQNHQWEKSKSATSEYNVFCGSDVLFTAYNMSDVARITKKYNTRIMERKLESEISRLEFLIEQWKIDYMELRKSIDERR